MQKSCNTHKMFPERTLLTKSKSCLVLWELDIQQCRLLLDHCGYTHGLGSCEIEA